MDASDTERSGDDTAPLQGWISSTVLDTQGGPAARQPPGLLASAEHCEWRPGDRCRARYEGDGRIYDAVVSAIAISSNGQPVLTVGFPAQPYIPSQQYFPDEVLKPLWRAGASSAVPAGREDSSIAHGGQVSTRSQRFSRRAGSLGSPKRQKQPSPRDNAYVASPSLLSGESLPIPSREATPLMRERRKRQMAQSALTLTDRVSRETQPGMSYLEEQRQRMAADMDLVMGPSLSLQQLLSKGAGGGRKRSPSRAAADQKRSGPLRSPEHEENDSEDAMLRAAALVAQKEVMAVLSRMDEADGAASTHGPRRCLSPRRVVSPGAASGGERPRRSAVGAGQGAPCCSEDSFSRDVLGEMLAERVAKKKRVQRTGAAVAASSDPFSRDDNSDEIRPTLVTPARDDNVPFVLKREDGGEQHEVNGHINQYLRDYQREGVQFMYNAFVEGRGALLADDMGLGKAQPLSAVLLTPKGWMPMGEVQRGDAVLGSDGRATSVVGVYPQGRKPIYRVSFSDGTSAECCGDHLWTVNSPDWRTQGSQWLTLSTQALANTGLKDGSGKCKWLIPVMKPAQFPQAELPLDPYVLGKLLSCGEIHPGATAAASVAERGEGAPPMTRLVAERVAAHLGSAASSVCDNENGFLSALCNLSQDDLGSSVPKIYKFAGEHQRLEVLRGLMDSCGAVTADGRVTFSCCSEQLSHDVAWLTRSLGGVACVEPSTSVDDASVYHVSMVVPQDMVIFTRPCMIDRLSKPAANEPSRFIESIEWVREDEAQCIRVAAADHLYVTDDFIVTHNTVQVIALLCAVYGKNGVGSHDNPHEFVRKQKGICSPGTVLIVAPTVVLYNWEGELKTWSHLRVGVCHGPNQHSVLEAAARQRYDVVITTYGTLMGKPDSFYEVPWLAVICDEAHRLKSNSSKTTQALKGFPGGGVRIALTGTALQNSFQELWCLFDWCNPDCLGNAKLFRKQVTDPILKGQSFKASVEAVGRARVCAERFQRLIQPMFLRRTKEIIKDQLPSKTDMVVFAAPSQLQRDVYNALLRTEAMEYITKRNEDCPCGSGAPRNLCCYQYTKDHLKGKPPTCKCPVEFKTGELGYNHRSKSCMVCHCDRRGQGGCMPQACFDLSCDRCRSTCPPLSP